MVDTLVYIKILFIKTWQQESRETTNKIEEGIYDIVINQRSYTERSMKKKRERHNRKMD